MPNLLIRLVTWNRAVSAQCRLDEARMHYNHAYRNGHMHDANKHRQAINLYAAQL